MVAPFTGAWIEIENGIGEIVCVVGAPFKANIV